jgi:hypothetical protein
MIGDDAVVGAGHQSFPAFAAKVGAFLLASLQRARLGAASTPTTHPLTQTPQDNLHQHRHHTTLSEALESLAATSLVSRGSVGARPMLAAMDWMIDFRCGRSDTISGINSDGRRNTRDDERDFGCGGASKGTASGVNTGKWRSRCGFMMDMCQRGQLPVISSQRVNFRRGFVFASGAVYTNDAVRMRLPEEDATGDVAPTTPTAADSALSNRESLTLVTAISSACRASNNDSHSNVAKELEAIPRRGMEVFDMLHGKGPLETLATAVPPHEMTSRPLCYAKPAANPMQSKRWAAIILHA